MYYNEPKKKIPVCHFQNVIHKISIKQVIYILKKY